jgi:dihydroorotate dehydrogenase
MKKPIYDIEKSYTENATHGPFFDGELPQRELPPRQEWIDFLGQPVASRFGVAAGPLLNSRWIGLASQLGYDLLTYKTIRSHPFASHPLPNMLYVDTEGELSGEREGGVVYQRDEPFTSLDELAVSNSFGNPSKSADFLYEDIARCHSLITEGQAVIVSVVGAKDDDLLGDFLKAAQIAKAAGAKIIETNFSCPNVTSKDGALYTSPDDVYRFTRAISQVIAPIPLIIKVGALLDPAVLRGVLCAAARGGAQAVSGINTIKMELRKRNGEPALGENRVHSGICGAPIRSVGLQFVRAAHKVIHEEKLDLTLIGVGGIVRPEHVDLYLEAGGDFAQTATGMMWDPYLAARYQKVWTSMV